MRSFFYSNWPVLLAFSIGVALGIGIGSCLFKERHHVSTFKEERIVEEIQGVTEELEGLDMKMKEKIQEDMEKEVPLEMLRHDLLEALGWEQ